MTPAPATASVLLLPVLPADESRSMKRYAYLSRLADVDGPRRIDRAWCRWVTYPGMLKQRSAAVFHILDQGYAHLVRSVDPHRTIVTCHDIIPLLAAERAIPAAVSARAAWTFRRKLAWLTRARRMIAVTSATKTTLVRHTSVDPQRIVVVHNGVNASFRFLPGVRSLRRATAGLDQTARVVLQVASGGAYKNTPALLRALARLSVRLPQIVLVRIGARLSPGKVDLTRTLGIADRLHDLGHVETDDLRAGWYNAADVFVFPSVWEGFGWPPLEAMACGTPVVASNTPAVAEVVGAAGLLVPPADVSALAAATERVLTDAALAADLRQQGFHQAAQFTWARTAARTAAVYAELLDDCKLGAGAAHDERPA